MGALTFRWLESPYGSVAEYDMPIAARETSKDHPGLASWACRENANCHIPRSGDRQIRVSKSFPAQTMEPDLWPGISSG
jgi:hypothetical protein